MVFDRQDMLWKIMFYLLDCPRVQASGCSRMLVQNYGPLEFPPLARAARIWTKLRRKAAAKEILLAFAKYRLSNFYNPNSTTRGGHQQGETFACSFASFGAPIRVHWKSHIADFLAERARVTGSSLLAQVSSRLGVVQEIPA